MSIQETMTLEGDTIVIRRTEYVADLVDWCKARHNEGLHGPKDFRLLARVPETVVEQYCMVHGVSAREFHRNAEHMKRILNDPDFRDLRVFPGKV